MYANKIPLGSTNIQTLVYIYIFNDILIVSSLFKQIKLKNFFSSLANEKEKKLKIFSKFMPARCSCSVISQCSSSLHLVCIPLSGAGAAVVTGVYLPYLCGYFIWGMSR